MNLINTTHLIKSTDFGIEKYGYNNDVDGAETIWTTGGAFDWSKVSTNAATTIVSTSTDDKGTPTAGTGLRTVQVEGLVNETIRGITGGRIYRETAILDGTDAVDLANDYSFVYRVVGLTAGSGGVNAGTIQVKHSTDVIADILIGSNNTEMALMIVPTFTADGALIKGAWIGGGYVYMAKNTAANANMVLLASPPNVSVFAVKARGNVTQNAPITFDYHIPQYVSAGTKIEVKSTAVSAADQEISAGFSLLYNI